MRKWNSNTIINLIGAILCILIVVFLFVFSEKKILFGVLFRGGFSVLIIYNAVYFIFSNKPSIIRRGQEKYRKFGGILLLFVGLFTFVTALMGYGINGYPLLDWRSVLSK